MLSRSFLVWKKILELRNNMDTKTRLYNYQNNHSLWNNLIRDFSNRSETMWWHEKLQEKFVYPSQKLPICDLHLNKFRTEAFSGDRYKEISPSLPHNGRRPGNGVRWHSWCADPGVAPPSAVLPFTFSSVRPWGWQVVWRLEIKPGQLRLEAWEISQSPEQSRRCCPEESA